MMNQSRMPGRITAFQRSLSLPPKLKAVASRPAVPTGFNGLLEDAIAADPLVGVLVAWQVYGACWQKPAS
jgi:hypothetical protein